MKVYACTEWDEPTQTCSAHAYVDMPGVLPVLAIEDAQVIGLKLVALFVCVRVVRMLGQAINNRIG